MAIVAMTLLVCCGTIADKLHLEQIRDGLDSAIADIKPGRYQFCDTCEHGFLECCGGVGLITPPHTEYSSGQIVCVQRMD